MGTLIIQELEVWYCVGVTPEERSQPQRLQLVVILQTNLEAAARTDDLSQTIDYYAVCQRLLAFGRNRSWQLIETLAVDIARMIQGEFAAGRVSVEIRKFIIPEARFVSVTYALPGP